MNARRTDPQTSHEGIPCEVDLTRYCEEVLRWAVAHGEPFIAAELPPGVGSRDGISGRKRISDLLRFDCLALTGQKRQAPRPFKKQQEVCVTANGRAWVEDREPLPLES